MAIAKAGRAGRHARKRGEGPEAARPGTRVNCFLPAVITAWTCVEHAGGAHTRTKPQKFTWMRPQSQTEAKPAESASSRYMTSSAVSSAPREAGDRKPDQAASKIHAQSAAIAQSA